MLYFFVTIVEEEETIKGDADSLFFMFVLFEEIGMGL